MSDKTKNTISWVLAGLVSFIFLGSAIGKFTADEEALKMASTFGLDAKANFSLGVIEIACLIFIHDSKNRHSGHAAFGILHGRRDCHTPGTWITGYCTLRHSSYLVDRSIC